LKGKPALALDVNIEEWTCEGIESGRTDYGVDTIGSLSCGQAALLVVLSRRRVCQENRVHLSSTEDLVYGWAKVSTVTNLNEIGVSGDVILHGYAYESTPNTAIAAGAVPEPTSLAIFAMGGAGIAAWKRRRKAVAQA